MIKWIAAFTSETFVVFSPTNTSNWFGWSITIFTTCLRYLNLKNKRNSSTSKTLRIVSTSIDYFEKIKLSCLSLLIKPKFKGLLWMSSLWTAQHSGSRSNSFCGCGFKPEKFNSEMLSNCFRKFRKCSMSCTGHLRQSLSNPRISSSGWLLIKENHVRLTSNLATKSTVSHRLVWKNL